MSLPSLDTRSVAGPDEMRQPGDFFFMPSGLAGQFWFSIWLPGAPEYSTFLVNQGPPRGRGVWGWDGNEVRPTITPEIPLVGVWRGRLVAGRLGTC